MANRSGKSGDIYIYIYMYVYVYVYKIAFLLTVFTGFPYKGNAIKTSISGLVRSESLRVIILPMHPLSLSNYDVFISPYTDQRKNC